MKNSAKSILAGLAAAFLLSVPAFAGAVEDGNASFAKGDFAAAARSYETAISSGAPSAGLYYNLGLAQVKNGDRPQAALSFQRALLLDPRLTDARMALSEIERSEQVPIGPASWRDTVSEKVSVSALMITGSVLAWIGAFWLLAICFQSRRRFLPVTAAFLLLVVGGAAIFAGYVADPRVFNQHAGVLLDAVTLHSAPADQSAEVVRLPAAATVQILSRRGDWTYCKAPTGGKGWAPSKSIADVVPTA